MAIAAMDGLVAGLCGSTAQKKPYFKYPSLGIKQAYWHSYWKENGYPTAGTTPTVFGSGGDVPTSATTGAIPITDPAGANSLYLTHISFELPFNGTSATGGQMYLLVDRLWACSGLVGNSTSVQTIVSAPALTRPDALGVGAELWVECYATPGVTAQTLTITYTNQAGVGSRTATCKFPATASNGDCQPAVLQAGDIGVQSVQSVQWGGSTGSAGNYGITILRRIAEIPGFAAFAGNDSDLFLMNMPLVNAGACLAVYATHVGTGQEVLTSGNLRLAEG